MLAGIGLQGQPITAIEPEHEINDVCHVPSSGLVLMAMDDATLLSYYIPVSFVLRQCHLPLSL